MLTLPEIMRAQNVTRWTLIATSREQSVAEHTFNVTMIARRFCKILGIPDELMIKACLEHDLDEVITGDIPSPTKRKMEQLGFDFKTIEGPMRHVPRLEAMDYAILKIADIVDAIHYLKNFGAGQRAKEVEAELESQLFDEMWPEFVHLMSEDFTGGELDELHSAILDVLEEG